MNARSGSAVLLLAQWSRYGVQLGGLVITARLLTPSDYGLITMVGAFTGLAGVIGNFGLSLAAIQTASLTQAQKTNLFWVNLALGTGSALLVCAAAAPIALFYSKPELTPIALALSATFVLNALGVQYAVELNRSGRWIALAGAEFAGPALGLVATIALALSGHGVWSLVVAQIVAPAAITALLMATVRWRPGLPRRGVGTRTLLTFGRDTLFLETMNYFTTNADSIILGRVSGASALGAYNRAYQLVSLPIQQIVAPLTRAVLPRLSKEARNGEFEALLRRCHRLICYGLLAPLSLLVAVAGPLIVILLGKQWSEVGELIRVLAVGAAFQALGFVYYWAFLAKAKTLDLFHSELWPRIVMILVMIMVADSGAPAIAWAATLGQFLIWAASTFIYGRRASVHWQSMLRVSARPVVLFSAAATLGLYLSLDRDPLIALGLGAGGWAFTVGVLALSPRIRADISECVRFVRGDTSLA